MFYLLIFINDICRDTFINHFGEDGWSWGAILLAGLLCQTHLVPFGAQWSLWVTKYKLTPAACTQTKTYQSHL